MSCVADEVYILRQHVEYITRELRKTRCQVLKLEWQNKHNKRKRTLKKAVVTKKSKKISCFFKPKPKCPMCQEEYSSSLDSHLNYCLKEDEVTGLENSFEAYVRI